MFVLLFVLDCFVFIVTDEIGLVDAFLLLGLFLKIILTMYQPINTKIGQLSKILILIF